MTNILSQAMTRSYADYPDLAVLVATVYNSTYLRVR